MIASKVTRLRAHSNDSVTHLLSKNQCPVRTNPCARRISVVSRVLASLRDLGQQGRIGATYAPLAPPLCLPRTFYVLFISAVRVSDSRILDYQSRELINRVASFDNFAV